MIGDLIKGIISPIIRPLVDRIPDPNERARAAEQAEAQIVGAMTSLVQGQLEINKTEAKHGNVFVAGWRPFIGWICGLGLAWNFVIAPLVSWGAFLAGVDIGNAPSLDIGELITLLFGMLGLGGMRSYEKRLRVDTYKVGERASEQ